MVCAGSASVWNCGAFCRMRRYFWQTCRDFCQTRRIFMAKGTAIQGLRCFTRLCTAAHQPSKCGAFGGRKAAHMPPCFQLPPRSVCCIRFDICRIYIAIFSSPLLLILFSLFLLPSPSSSPSSSSFQTAQHSSPHSHSQVQCVG